MNDYRINKLVAIDPAIKDFHILQDYISEGAIPQADVVILEPNSQEIEQISCALRKNAQLTELHIISQGSPGFLYLGNSSLSVYNLNYYTSQLKTWSVKNIFLYGCNIGSKEICKKFVLRLYKTTGANISTLVSSWGMHTKVGVGIWNTSQYTSIKPDFAALTV